MDIAIGIILLISNMVMAHRLGQLKPPRQYRDAYELEAPKAHRLVRTWMEPDPIDGGLPGWRFLCSCGTQGMATNIKDRVLGSEENVVKQFSGHAALFASVNEDGWKRRYETLKAQFDWYIEKCYCKDTNNDLIEWRAK